jgi:RNA polymerase sigma-70 factor, ECF subfamily
MRWVGKAVGVDLENEREFVDRAKAGDRAAFSALVGRYWLPLCRWLAGMTGRIQTAEDLTQEAFVRAWSALPVLKDGQAFRVWLFRIARNAMLLGQRGPRGIARPALDDKTASHDSGPLNSAMESEGQAALRYAIERLPELYRAAYLLWFQEEFPYSEIARVLSITEETARWRVCEARRMLVKQLKSFLDQSS